MSAVSDPATIDEQADAASDAVGQLGLFVRLATEMPEVLDFFPDTGELAFREVEIHGHTLQLTAVHPGDADAWVARPSRYALRTGASVFQRPIPGIPDDPGDPSGRTLAIVESFGTTGSTAIDALDALEAKLRAAIDEALRVDLAETGRRG